MRAREFIVEYNRGKTAEVTGNKLLVSLMNDTSQDPAVRATKGSLNTKLRDVMSRYWNDPDVPMPTEEQSIPQLPEEVQSQYIDSVLSLIEHRDPTPNKAYTPWLARCYAMGGLPLEDINRNSTLAKYDVAKKRNQLDPRHRDINSFKSAKSDNGSILNPYLYFEAIVEDTYDFDTLSEKEVDQLKANSKAKTVLDNDVVRIIIPENEAAACYYGRGTRWCTSSTQGDNMFKNYANQGSIYILLPKKPTYIGEKYQIHFQTNSYMNEKDDEVEMMWLLESRFGELIPFFRKIDSYVNGLLVFSDETVIKHVMEYVIDRSISEIEDIAELMKDDLKGKMSNEDIDRWAELNLETLNEMTSSDILEDVFGSDNASEYSMMEIPTIMADLLNNLMGASIITRAYQNILLNFIRKLQVVKIDNTYTVKIPKAYG